MARRPKRGYLVVVDGHPVGGFAEDAEAWSCAAPYGDAAAVLPFDWWPAGVWFHGITGKVSRDSIPRVVHQAQHRHARVSRSCVGAGLEVATENGQRRYYCARRGCQARVW
ncbi:MAG: hypothetical protein J2P20_08790 [Pseudonocardia sp.]|nr:hypothetical protein [Pseudonocardia sp.]